MARAPGCSAARTRSSAARRAARPPRRRTARAAPRAGARGTSRGRSRPGSPRRRRRRRRRACPAPHVGEAERAQARLGVRRRGEVPVARPAGQVLGERLARARARSPAPLTASTLPSPPHWATSRPPGFSAARRRANSRSWSPIQWKVAVETIASTGSSSSSSSRSASRTSTVGRAAARRASLDHRARAVDGDHAPARQPLGQRRGHPAGAAARVEHGLVAAQPQPRQHVAAHRLERRAEPLVGGGVPVARRHTRRTHRVRPAAPPRRRRGRPARPPRPRAAATCPARGRRRCSGSVESGRPTPTRTRWKSGAAELALERLQAVVAGQPAAEAGADVAEREVDLVVDDDAAGRGRACRSRARGRPSGRPRSCRSAGAAARRAGRPGRCGPRLSSPANFFLGFGSSQRRASSSATLKPTLCGVSA